MSIGNVGKTIGTIGTINTFDLDLLNKKNVGKLEKLGGEQTIDNYKYSDPKDELAKLDGLLFDILKKDE
jgi:hypothetical protein